MKKNKLLHIEGLRAIAVILVILYHSGLDLLKGGFIGVDVFLVVSGFLMSYTVYKKNIPFKIFEFYNKRFMRLYPHLVFMLLTVSVITYFILPPYLLNESAQSAAAAILSVSNVYFYYQADYFGSESLVRPFIHTWSLGLEMQFYVIFGLIVTFLSKRNVCISLVVLSLVSFFINIAVVNEMQAAAYFLLPSRFWEFGVGSLLFFIPSIRSNSYNKLFMILLAFSFIGLLYSAYAYHSGLLFPGYFALAPVIFTSILILYTPKFPFLNHILKFKLLVFLGGLSYGLYLWHQPIFALIRINSTDEPNLFLLLVACLLSILISYFCKVMIEDKCRKLKLFEPKVLLLNSFTVSSLVIFAYLSTITSGFKGRLEDLTNLGSYFYDVNTEKNSGIKILRGTQESLNFYQHYKEGDSSKKILFIGDSMAHDVSASLAHFDDQQSPIFDVRLYRVDSDCFYFSSDTSACKSSFENSFNVINDLSPDFLVISALWKKGSDFEYFKAYFEKIKTIYSKPIIIFGSTGFNDLYSLAYEVASYEEEVSEDKVAKLTYNHKRSKFEYGNMKAMETANALGLHFWDRKNTFCNALQMRCHILRDNDSPYIWDNAHLTSSGMEKTFHYFRNNFNEIFNSNLEED